MQRTPLPFSFRQAVTLLEMTVVIMVLLALIGMGLFSTRKYSEWRQGRAASESLRDVYTAQRLYLADNPTTPVANLTGAMIIPYLPNNATALPVVRSLTGGALTIRLTSSPPVFLSGSTVYDPSGSPSDSLWDVGE
ncbi:MAG: type II secretion system protein [Luteolibacter sp.]